MAEPYHYVRFRWWTRIDLKGVSEDLSGLFHVEMFVPPSDERELVFKKDVRRELKVSADTLTARLSAFRAVLSQKEAAPFTARDLELRKKVLELYPRSRPTPFPWLFGHEPKFEEAK